MENILLEWVNFNEIWLIKIKISKFFARVKPGSANETAEDDETNREKQKQLDEDDEQPVENGWKVSGTIKNHQRYLRPPFIQEIIQVLLRYHSNLYIIILFSL
jgi:hypothetical protein